MSQAKIGPIRTYIRDISELPSYLKRLWLHLKPVRRTQVFLLMGLMVAVSAAEVISIGAILSFLAVLTDPGRTFHHPRLQFLWELTGIQSPEQMVLPMTIAFACAALVTGGARLLFLWANTRLCNAIGADLAYDVYRRTLFQPYFVHVGRNSSEVATATSKAKGLVNQTISPLLTIFGSLCVIVSIVSFLVTIDPVVSLSAVAGFSTIYFVIAIFSKNSLDTNGRILARELTRATQTMSEGLGGIRDILLDGSQDFYSGIFRTSDRRLNRANANATFLAGTPRFAIEAVAMVLLAGFAYALTRSPGGLNQHIPLLGAMALGAQRILPVMQATFVSWTNVKISQSTMREVLGFLDQPLPAYATEPPPIPMAFKDRITLDHIGFRYSEEGPWVLRDVTMEIPHGSRVGIVGITGSGKSTLLDILLALLVPTEGRLLVDGVTIDGTTMRAWQANVAHVPQMIYLSDTSIAENIAFGVPADQIDMDRVKRAASQAQISSHIETLQAGYQTFVGERGIRLSGGQRQRIGIARALYKQASVIVFDEATSALDNETEQAVMEAIEGLGKDLTILMIAHRLSTVKNCDQVIELGAGQIRRAGKYEELFAAHN